ncbi:MAG TPA: hypothetical protein PLD47_00705, partial [Aggregatilineales bacterium]|nr:hypothetical protein [Aggregatilineales bacterium]
QPFRFVFWLSVIPGVLAVITFLIFVQDPEQSANPAPNFFAALRRLPTRFRRYLRAVGLFGIGDFSHSLLILAATQLLTPSLGVIQAAQIAGLLYIWRNIVQVVTSYPIGLLGDRIGSYRVLSMGYGLGAFTALLTVAAFWFKVDSVVFLGGIFLVAGLYIAVQEALESTVTAEMVSQETLTMSYGTLGAVNGTTKFISSTLVGVLWTAVSPLLGFGVAAALMIAGTGALLSGRTGNPV